MPREQLIHWLVPRRLSAGKSVGVQERERKRGREFASFIFSSHGPSRFALVASRSPSHEYRIRSFENRAIIM